MMTPRQREKALNAILKNMEPGRIGLQLSAEDLQRLSEYAAANPDARKDMRLLRGEIRRHGRVVLWFDASPACVRLMTFLGYDPRTPAREALHKG